MIYCYTCKAFRQLIEIGPVDVCEECHDENYR